MPVRAAAALLAALLLGFGAACLAQVAVPPLTARVTDQTATLSAAQVASLDATLAAFEARKGSQIAVLMVPSTRPESIEQYGIRVVDQWRLGRKHVDDGALLLIAKDDHAVRIEVGYGLEGALNDAVSERIISEIITPKFRQGDFYGGISDGIARMIGVVDGEALPPPAQQLHPSGTPGMEYLPILLVAAAIAGSLLRALFGRLPAALLAGGGGGVLMWFFVGTLVAAVPVGLIIFVFTLLGGFPAGRVVGGGGFGGFGGFGGGGFGGGGASGSW